MTPIETGPCERTVRLATPGDAARVAELYAPFVRETTVSFEWQAPTVDEMRRRIADTLASLPWLVAVDGRSANVDGYAYASPYRGRAAYQWSVEVTVYVADEARRGGVGARLYRSLLAILAAQGYRVAYAVVALPNPPSVAFHERLAFERVGLLPAAGYKLGRWCDVLWMRRELARPDPDPAPPIPLPRLAPAVVRSALDRGGP